MDPVARELLGQTTLTRLAYTALDGSPRVVPIGFVMRGTSAVVCSASIAPKVQALRRDPRVALTIDVKSKPPQALLLRGTAEIEIVEGVPEEYLESSRPNVPDGHWDEFEADVRDLYDEMARISISIHWAKVLDFQTRMPESIVKLASRRESTPPGSPPTWSEQTPAIDDVRE